MPIYAFDGVRPRVGAGAYVHPDAVLIGHVTLGPESSVWPGAVLRGDHGRIEVGARTSVQDGTVVHTTRQWPTVIGDECVVGHNAHLEGCTVAGRCLVGSMSVVLNRAVIGGGSVVAAAALVPEGLDVPERSMVVGVPGRVKPLPDERMKDRIEHGVDVYVDFARRYPQALTRVDLAECRVDGPG
ncbi:gamma carbonic anhydrase family protein [Streptomyces sp. WMMB 322]|uniref:gamma carbonic anhydrase family protein n=1 Tax=Streptomyces sp. WMMB 322 TaxID=1286821 RepID=UPI0006E1C6E4|nr:gamma carbonic anhydrase family protein [Streptomyces sp. WMMB 322]SCK46007.1 Carbonic anhydrase or acetyltransferase, isoleucine patch superfamily [Streptomyces sp. WMMB 322]